MKDTILCHHSANPSSAPQAKGIVAQHLKTPKIMQAGAYHFVIERADGKIVQLHPEEFIGHHAGSWPVNLRSIGICLAGNFTQQEPTAAQIESLARLVTDLQARWGIPDSRILLHREVRKTQCPGTDLRPLIFEHRKKLLHTKLTQLKQAEERTTGKRKLRLQRLIVRILKLVS